MKDFQDIIFIWITFKSNEKSQKNKVKETVIQ